MEAFQQLDKALLEAMVLAIIFAVVVELVFRLVRKNRENRNLINDIRKLRKLSPPATKEFTELTITWKNADGEHTVSSLSEIHSNFESLLQSKHRTALVMGKFGMGKTFLSKYLSGLGSLEEGRNILPVYLDATRFVSGKISSEIISQLNEHALFDLGLTDFRALCDRPETAFIIDGLDQMPTAERGGEILSGTLDLLKFIFEERASKATAILVVRSEFYETSTKLQELTQDGQLPLIIVKGFTEDWQREKFLLNADPEYGSIRLGKLRELTASNDQLNELFERPLLLQRFTKIPLADVHSMVPSGVTLAKTYRLSFKELDTEAEEAVRLIAGDLYADANYATPMAGNLAEWALGKNDPAIAQLKQAGILYVDNQSLHFSHVTFRDYFVAESILSAISEGRGEEALGGRIIHYLVSEFVAGLLDNELLFQLLETIANSKDKFVRFNGMDILTEIVDNANREIAKSYLERKINNLDFTSDKFDTEKIFFGSIAGIYGMVEPTKYVLKHLRRLGAQGFMLRFFYTRDMFSYYDKSEDRCYAEWLDQLNTRKHGYFRVISCALLADMGITRAIPVLTKVTENLEEDAWVRKSAGDALSILRNIESS